MSTPYSPIIYMEDVTKIFRNGNVEARVLNGIDLEIHLGEYISIVGPSGCGKSTLLAIMGLMDTPTSGVYLFDGKPVNNLNASARAKIRNHDIGFVFQSFNLLGDLTVFENVEQPLAYQNLKSSVRKERVQEALEQVKLVDQAKRRPSQLSGGQQQKVAVARAIVGRPRILLADEPTGNLDSASGEAIMEMLRDLHSKGTTICMVTHDPRFVHMANRLVNMLDGKMTDEMVPLV
ncbi:MAG TPA: ABC transporter ATP-binding protein [Blastocatellia bacterium]|nr:ABC transporter ATP-binding protein [Blastocatellia bacterium]